MMLLELGDCSCHGQHTALESQQALQRSLGFVEGARSAVLCTALTVFVLLAGADKGIELLCLCPEKLGALKRLLDGLRRAGPGSTTYRARRHTHAGIRAGIPCC